MHVAVHRCTRKRSLDAGSWRHSLCISYRELPQQGALYAPAKNWFPGDGAWTAGAHQKECVRPRHQSTHMLAGPSGGYKRELPTTDGAGKYKFEQSPMDPCVFMLRRWTGDGPHSPTWAAMWMTYSLGTMRTTGAIQAALATKFEVQTCESDNFEFLGSKISVGPTASR